MAAGSSSSELVDYRQSIRMQAELLLGAYTRRCSCIRSYMGQMFHMMGIGGCSSNNLRMDNRNHNNYYSQH